jgi:hypothetical protein
MIENSDLCYYYCADKNLRFFQMQEYLNIREVNFFYEHTV